MDLDLLLAPDLRRGAAQVDLSTMERPPAADSRPGCADHLLPRLPVREALHEDHVALRVSHRCDGAAGMHTGVGLDHHASHRALWSALLPAASSADLCYRDDSGRRGHPHVWTLAHGIERADDG